MYSLLLFSLFEIERKTRNSFFDGILLVYEHVWIESDISLIDLEVDLIEEEQKKVKSTEKYKQRTEKIP